MVEDMLPPAIDQLAHTFRYFSGVGKRSSGKLALDVLQLDDEQFQQFFTAVQQVRSQVKFCTRCGFFAESDLCAICQDTHRHHNQLCLVEKPTDVISVEKSGIYRGQFHVLNKLISPLDNIFAEDTSISDLLERIQLLLNDHDSVELILFFKAGFAGEATTAYLREALEQKNLSEKVSVTRLAQGLPLYFNTDTLDQATMVKALEDRRRVA